MVLFNKCKFRQQTNQKKEKVLGQSRSKWNARVKFSQAWHWLLIELKKQLEAREAHVSNMAMKRLLLEGQHQANYEMEMSRLREEMHNPRIPETSLEHLKNRYEKLGKLSSANFYINM